MSHPRGGISRYPRKAFAITKSDATVFPRPVTVYVGGVGDVTVVPWSQDATVTFVGLPAGSTVPVEVRMVMSTGTAATAMVGVYDV